MLSPAGALAIPEVRLSNEVRRRICQLVERLQQVVDPEERFGHSLSNRKSFARNFVILAVTTTLIISIVKSSLALSLGLVGALSIVRFRAAIKEPEELILITKAVELADAVFERAKDLIHPGMTEKEAAWEIEKSLRQKGSEVVPFEIIVPSGSNSALPHAQPTEKAICSGEPVLIDMGSRIKGYCSDLSRTLFLGKPNETFQKIYSIVLKAQATAIEGIKSGMARLAFFERTESWVLRPFLESLRFLLIY